MEDKKVKNNEKLLKRDTIRVLKCKTNQSTKKDGIDENSFWIILFQHLAISGGEQRW